MKHEDIKVGHVYNVRVRVVDVDDDTGEITTETANENGYALGFEWCYYAPGEALAFSPITAENGIKNTEPAPKYDTCRLFKKGDKVRLRRRDGRTPHEHAYDMNVEEDGVIRTVLHDEEDGLVSVDWGVDDDICVPFFYIELVTPVELEPYSVQLRKEMTLDDTYPYCAVIDDDGNEAARFYCEQYEAGKARAAAEAECKRLNAEYRKENSHE